MKELILLYSVNLAAKDSGLPALVSNTCGSILCNYTYTLLVKF